MNILVKHPRSGLLPTVLYELSYLQSRARVNESWMQKQCRVFGIHRYILASQSIVIMPMRCDFNGTKASADSEERSVYAGSRHLHRSPGQEDTMSFANVKWTATMNAFVKRWKW